MRRILVILIAATSIISLNHNLKADVIAGWTFETSVPVTAGPHAAETGTGSALGFHANASVVYSNPAGNGSAESFSSNFWETGDYYQFGFSSAGRTNIGIQFDQTRSGTGPDAFKIQFSTDGTNYSDFGNGTYSVPSITWTSGSPNAQGTVSFAFGGLLDNVSTASIRLAATVPGSSTAGSNRVDNVLISDNVTAVPEPTSILFIAVAGLVGCATRLRRVIPRTKI